MSNVKQVIVMRKDLKNTKGEKVRSGKLIAQGAHASMKVILDMDDGKVLNYLKVQLNDDLQKWIKGIFTKICLAAKDKGDLLESYNKAKEAGLPCALILDSGKTEFSEPTYTCCAIGPAKSEDIDKITGHLKLF